MAISVATNSKNDIFIGADKNIVLVRDVFAVMQDCEHKMKALFQEMIYQYDQGIPYFDVVFDQLNIPQFEGISILALLDVPDVTNVTDFTAALVGKELKYEATIETVYGTDQLTGSLTNG